MNAHITICIVLAASIVLPGVTKAELLELGREGNLVSLEGAFPGIASRMKTALAAGYRPPRSNLRNTDLTPKALPSPYPIETNLVLSDQGSILVRNNYQGPPACIVGSDDVSKRWLEANRPTLVKLKVNCILIQARNDHQVLVMRKIASPLALAAIELSDPLAELGVREYPVLIVSQETQQQLSN